MSTPCAKVPLGKMSTGSYRAVTGGVGDGENAVPKNVNTSSISSPAANPFAITELGLSEPSARVNCRQTFEHWVHRGELHDGSSLSLAKPCSPKLCSSAPALLY